MELGYFLEGYKFDLKKLNISTEFDFETNNSKIEQQFSQPIISPSNFFAGRLEIFINRENTLKIAKRYTSQNKENFENKVLFYNWLEQ